MSPTANRRVSRQRERRAFNSRLEPELIDALRAQAASVDLPMGTYLELLIAEVHDYHGQYLAELAEPLPTAVPLEDLRRAMEHPRPLPRRVGVRGQVSVPSCIRTDKPLAEEITRRCRELDLAYSDYLRNLFFEAAGLPYPTDVPGQRSTSSTEEDESRLAEAS